MAAKLRILVASAPRSGGTWLFNATRLVLGLKGGDVHAAWCQDYNSEHPAEYHVIKAHGPNQVSFEPSAILTTHRDVFERLASLMRMGWLQTTPSAVLAAHQAQNSVYEYWKQRSTLEIEYEGIITAPAEAIKTIGKALDVDISDQQAQEFAHKLAEIEAPSEGSYDRTTLLHKNHRSDGSVTAATAAQIRELIAKAG